MNVFYVLERKKTKIYNLHSIDLTVQERQKLNEKVN